MRVPPLGFVLFLALSSACSVDVDQPKATTQSQYQLVIEGESFYLFDTRTGELREKRGDEWREVVGPVER
ncbi:MAG: hypothetical protein GY711_24220 [bacterium]|nr:hypothetical protein [bacterium]